MSAQNTPKNLSLFPCRDSLQEVEQEALALLPITSANQLIALLRLQQNTLVALLKPEVSRGR